MFTARIAWLTPWNLKFESRIDIRPGVLVIFRTVFTSSCQLTLVNLSGSTGTSSVLALAISVAHSRFASFMKKVRLRNTLSVSTTQAIILALAVFC
jgi:hypothetical protein